MSASPPAGGPLPRSVRDLARRLEAAGLDLLHPFDAAAYDAARPAGSGLAPLDRFGRAGALALLVGNTRALWAPLTAALGQDRELAADPHPLDAYVTREVLAACRTLDVAHHIYLGHLRERDARADPTSGAAAPSPVRHVLVSLPRAAAAAGLASLSPVHLAVHPEHGPWFALRALIVLDAAAGAAPDVARNWRTWVAVRDACPVGRASRYGATQLRYHYTKERALLS